MKIRMILLSLSLIAVAACATGGNRAPNYTDADYGPLPGNYKEVAEAYVKQNLRDPYSAHIRVSDAAPEKGIGYTTNHQQIAAYQVKVYVNAKNAMGGYTGEHLMIVFISHGQAVNVFDLSHTLESL